MAPLQLPFIYSKDQLPAIPNMTLDARLPEAHHKDTKDTKGSRVREGDGWQRVVWQLDDGWDRYKHLIA